ncbi:hypothetical protein LR48_Vigan08g039200 [Vigna angularis]|uniref:Ubiquitin-like protease family profile domain-containing protein n=1 Tax=Phaseolus angularis TaxID=3914 RepID=A0A0L9V3C7_PHAAN|nr:hypothetical protein LR48_Vigan08g039200 [Vigna angularis]
MRKRHAEELGLESPDLAPPPARHELWKAARTKSNGQFTSQSAQKISQRILQVYRPEKLPIAQLVNDAREEAEDHDAISILTSRLNKLRKEPVEMLWELRTFGLECHVPLYINFDDAYDIIGGEKMLNIACIQLWCMGHWQLMVIIPKKAQVVWFCSLHRKIKAELKSVIQTVVTRTRGQQLEIIYPKNDSWACGYYIMSWMKAIIRAKIRGEWTKVEVYI